MRKRTEGWRCSIGWFVFLVFLVFPLSSLSAEEGGAPSMEEMIARWRATITPGAHHEWLRAFAGEWETVMRTWWGGPRVAPVETKGHATIVSILGGRFLMERYRGEVALPDERGEMRKAPFEGVGMLGYDNFRNLYVATWQDTMGTAISTMQGNRARGTNELRLFGRIDEPMLHVVGRTVKYVRRILDADTHRFEMYDLHAGDRYKVLEITYKREKAKPSP